MRTQVRDLRLSFDFSCHFGTCNLLVTWLYWLETCLERLACVSTWVVPLFVCVKMVCLSGVWVERVGMGTSRGWAGAYDSETGETAGGDCQCCQPGISVHCCRLLSPLIAWMICDYPCAVSALFWYWCYTLCNTWQGSQSGWPPHPVWLWRDTTALCASLPVLHVLEPCQTALLCKI